MDQVSHHHHPENETPKTGLIPKFLDFASRLHKSLDLPHHLKLPAHQNFYTQWASLSEDRREPEPFGLEGQDEVVETA